MPPALSKFECDPDQGHACCNDVGECTNATGYCDCVGCTDYRDVKKWREAGNQMILWKSTSVNVRIQFHDESRI